MKKRNNQYDEIRSQLEERVIECRKRLKDISTKSISDLPLSKVQDLKKFCSSEYEEMTKFLMVDLYHIVGMVDMTTRQVQDFYKLVKEYSGYRPDVKAINKSLTTLYDIPNVPVRTQFRLLSMKGITLTSGPEEAEEVEDTTSMNDYEELKEKTEVEEQPKVENSDVCVGGITPIEDFIKDKIGKVKPDITIKGDYVSWIIHNSPEEYDMACRIFFRMQNPNDDYINMTATWRASCTKIIRASKGFGLVWSTTKVAGERQIIYRMSQSKTLHRYIVDYIKLVDSFDN